MTSDAHRRFAARLPLPVKNPLKQIFLVRIGILGINLSLRKEPLSQAETSVAVW
ncbi:hypothetical protein H6G36_30535 [Anabaena minutissima FACHB-250]|nr:hypothetical protein [Anabaena minutissima FACHB-250]